MSKGTTTGVFVLLVSLIIIFGLISNSILLAVALIVPFGAVLSFPYLWAAQGYKLHDNLVVIKRPIGEARITMAQHRDGDGLGGG